MFEIFLRDRNKAPEGLDPNSSLQEGQEAAVILVLPCGLYRGLSTSLLGFHDQLQGQVCLQERLFWATAGSRTRPGCQVPAAAYARSRTAGLWVPSRPL